MKNLFLKMTAGLLAATMLISASACNSNSNATDSTLGNGSQQTEASTSANGSDNTTQSFLNRTEKVPLKNVYVDVPPYNTIEAGYTQIYLQSSKKLVAFACHVDASSAGLKEAYDLMTDFFKNSVDSYHRVNEFVSVQTTEVTVNSIDTWKLEGTVKAGRSVFYDAYVYGYTFIFEGMPCSIIGSVMAVDQPEEEKQELKAIIDEMMTTVRNTK